MKPKFEDLLGKILTSITGCEKGSEKITFCTRDGEEYILYHIQDCCESVTVEDVCGDVNDLLNSPILLSREDTSEENPKNITPPKYQESFTWTFYNIATCNGHVTIRWYGKSNGYYSESVEFDIVQYENDNKN